MLHAGLNRLEFGIMLRPTRQLQAEKGVLARLRRLHASRALLIPDALALKHSLKRCFHLHRSLSLADDLDKLVEELRSVVLLSGSELHLESVVCGFDQALGVVEARAAFLQVPEEPLEFPNHPLLCALRHTPLLLVG